MNSQVKRNSNIELFRIILIFMIISHHYVVNSGITALFNSSIVTKHMIFYQIVGFGGKIGIDAFLLITGYFMCDKKISMHKFWKLVLTIFFYRILFNIIFLISGYLTFDINFFINEIPIIMFLRTGNDSFTALYIIMFLMIPYLNMVINSCSKKEYQRLLFILLFVFTFVSTFINDNWEGLGWYCTVFLIGGYIKKYDSYIFSNIKYGIISTFIGIILAIGSIILIDYGFLSKEFNYYFYVVGGNKLLAIFIAISLFLIFKNLKIEYNKFINRFASATFGVFLIHANSDTMRHFLWNDVLHVTTYYSASFYVSFFHWLFSIVIIYVYCVIIELARIRFVHKIFKRKWIK